MQTQLLFLIFSFYIHSESCPKPNRNKWVAIENRFGTTQEVIAIGFITAIDLYLALDKIPVRTNQ